MAFGIVFDMSSQVTCPVAHPVVEAVGAAFDGLGAVRDAALFGLADDELDAAIEGCHGVRARVFDTELALVAEADGRDLGRRLGAASTAAWLRDRFRLRPGDARRLVDLANRTRIDDGPVDYSANVRGKLSGRELPATGSAVAEGVISPEHVAIVGKVMRNLPKDVPVDKAQQVEADLAGFCRQFDPLTVAKLGDCILHMLAEETLDDRENERHRKRELRLDETTGRISGQLTAEGLALLRTALDPLAAPAPAADGEHDPRSAGQRLADALVELARRAIAADSFEANHGISHRVMVMVGLDTLTAGHECPDDGDGDDGDASAGGETGDGRRSDFRGSNFGGAAPAAGAVTTDAAASAADEKEASGGSPADETAGTDGAASTADATAAGEGSPVDETAATHGAMRANGSPASAESKAAAPQPASRSATARRSGTGCSAKCPITAAEAARRIGAGVAPGELIWAGAISAAAVRRIACSAGIQRVVLDPAGAVLDVGREYRSATPAQFAALIARDGGCAFPGCTRLPAWCIAHHIIHWVDGGPTNLDNLVLLCSRHHTVVHHHGWDIALGADRLPDFYPPPWVDPDRTPMRNTRPRYRQTHITPDR